MSAPPAYDTSAPPAAGDASQGQQQIIINLGPSPQQAGGPPSPSKHEDYNPYGQQPHGMQHSGGPAPTSPYASAASPYAAPPPNPYAPPAQNPYGAPQPYGAPYGAPHSGGMAPPGPHQPAYSNYPAPMAVGQPVGPPGQMVMGAQVVGVRQRFVGPMTWTAIAVTCPCCFPFNYAFMMCPMDERTIVIAPTAVQTYHNASAY